MLFNSHKRWLVISPHTDDWELACGATVARLIEEGHEIHVVILSAARESIPEHMDWDSTQSESKAVCELYGISEDRVTRFNFQVRRFSEWRQDILENLVQIRAEIKPHAVLAPWNGDTHQDHEVVANEAVRAFKGISLLQYKFHGTLPILVPNLYVKVLDRHFSLKLRAVELYRSQAHRNYMDGRIIRTFARADGFACGATYAEGFRVERWVV